MIIRNGGQVILGGKKAGYLQSDSEGRMWYVSPRKRDLHFFRKFSSWGVAEELVEYLLLNKVYGVRLVIDGHYVLRSSLEVLKSRGRRVQYPGYEPQILLEEYEWLREQSIL